ncbi:hypothetical protein GOP47_0028441 [Adiantum capillus-veneris]|nr:hypothetical protein GOP47_0028441 [Adiantum capillus-veneris]
MSSSIVVEGPPLPPSRNSDTTYEGACAWMRVCVVRYGACREGEEQPQEQKYAEKTSPTKNGSLNKVVYQVPFF